ncbi:MAG TPA: flagellar hook capping FlgD N-terminal domain-containing protein [Terracidiphilus sp.]|nr:flagellar hook capping FlgD N-terminal domain-containing protein [Terracidiphilus sp.]
MATTIAGIFNHAMRATQAMTGTAATPMTGPTAEAAGSSKNSSSSDSSSATISANDFLTLLVTEMKNQDPTANTDPNQYINQLVNVNSLEQLININQNLATALGYSNTGSASAGTGQTAGTTSALTDASPAGTSSQASAGTHKIDAPAAGQSAVSSTDMSNNLVAFAAVARSAHGNLSVPDADPAAHSVAQALSGQSRAQSIARVLSVAK